MGHLFVSLYEEHTDIKKTIDDDNDNIPFIYNIYDDNLQDLKHKLPTKRYEMQIYIGLYKLSITPMVVKYIY